MKIWFAVFTFLLVSFASTAGFCAASLAGFSRSFAEGEDVRVLGEPGTGQPSAQGWVGQSRVQKIGEKEYFVYLSGGLGSNWYPESRLVSPAAPGTDSMVVRLAQLPALRIMPTPLLHLINAYLPPHEVITPIGTGHFLGWDRRGRFISAASSAQLNRYDRFNHALATHIAHNVPSDLLTHVFVNQDLVSLTWSLPSARGGTEFTRVLEAHTTDRVAFSPVEFSTAIAGESAHRGELTHIAVRRYERMPFMVGRTAAGDLFCNHGRLPSVRMRGAGDTTPIRNASVFTADPSGQLLVVVRDGVIWTSANVIAGCTQLFFASRYDGPPSEAPGAIASVVASADGIAFLDKNGQAFWAVNPGDAVARFMPLPKPTNSPPAASYLKVVAGRQFFAFMRSDRRVFFFAPNLQTHREFVLAMNPSATAHLIPTDVEPAEIELVERATEVFLIPDIFAPDRSEFASCRQSSAARWDKLVTVSEDPATVSTVCFDRASSKEGAPESPAGCYRWDVLRQSAMVAAPWECNLCTLSNAAGAKKCYACDDTP